MAFSMKNLLKNKNFWVLAVIFVVIACLFVAARTMPVSVANGRQLLDMSNSSVTIELDSSIPVMDLDHLMAKPIGFSLIPTACAEEAGQATEDAPITEEVPQEQAKPTSEPIGVVFISTSDGYLPLPVYDDFEYSFPVTQLLDDGTEAINVVHVIPRGVFMESSTCDNQDCVDEGTVTLENKADRILSNWIICLPNNVMVELYSMEEIEAMAAEAQAAQQ